MKYDSRPGSYRRMKVEKCPVHGEGCHKTRTFSAKFAAASGLGEEEPFAYLGCWLSLGEDRDQFPDAQSHKTGWPNKKGPSVEEVKTCARTLGWMPEEEGTGF